MAILKVAAALALGAKLALARHCQNITVPVTISAENIVFDAPLPSNNVEAANFVLNLNRQGYNYAGESSKGMATVGGTYQLGATYCAPDSGHGKTLQILTHGGGFDRSYWDPSYNNYNYSYVDVAVEEFGFSTLAWDRLGIAESQQGLNALLEVQPSLEIAALKALTDTVHNGTLPGCKEHQFEKVVHVGHSLGSIVTLGLISVYPTSSDGVVLTAFSPNGTYASYFSMAANFVSSLEVPAWADKYPAGYVGSVTPTSVQLDFLAEDQFDPEILPWIVANGAPNAVGELLTLGGGGASSYTGPVLVITGERDLPFCGGDCLLTGDPELPNIPTGTQAIIPDAEPFQVIIVPGAGHGLNFEYSAKDSYAKINKFLS